MIVAMRSSQEFEDGLILFVPKIITIGLSAPIALKIVNKSEYDLGL